MIINKKYNNLIKNTKIIIIKNMVLKYVKLNDINLKDKKFSKY